VVMNCACRPIPRQISVAVRLWGPNDIGQGT
jgi:hypothetical protein